MVKLIDPNYGRLVTLQVLEEEPILQMEMRILTAIADGEKVKSRVSGNTVTLTFSDADTAEAYRNAWKEKLKSKNEKR